MTRRIATLSVAITLVWAPIASAQSPEAASPVAAPASTALLSASTFARLVQPRPADVAPTPVVAASPRLDLLRQGTAAMASEARATAAKAPPPRNWASRHSGVLYFVGIVGGLLTVALIYAQ